MRTAPKSGHTWFPECISSTGNITSTPNKQTPQKLGKSAKYLVAAVLLSHGRSVKIQAYNGPFDLLVDGKTRIEVKCARPHMQRGIRVWTFNLHRHGVLKENADFYILRMEGVPDTDTAVHLLVKSPVGRKTFVVSIRSLLNGKAALALAFQKFARTGIHSQEAA